jgi:Sulfatase-modifying factor enzyme 1
LLGHSITYRIATGPREGQKEFTLQTLPADPDGPRRNVAEASGFSLHAGVAAKGSERDKLEHLARYVSRPARQPPSPGSRADIRLLVRTIRRWIGFGYLYIVFGLLYVNLCAWFLSLFPGGFGWVLVFTALTLAQLVIGARLHDARSINANKHNIFEWVQDCYEADLADAPTDGTANTEGDCSARVFRSGTHLSNPYMQRTARRGAPYPTATRGRNYLGFRVAKTVD